MSRGKREGNGKSPPAHFKSTKGPSAENPNGQFPEMTKKGKKNQSHKKPCKASSKTVQGGRERETKKARKEV